MTDLGKFITKDHKRDAVHVAIAPVVSGSSKSLMLPGQHVKLIEVGSDMAVACHESESVGIDLLLACGKARGGSEYYGGVIWLDWNEEFEPIPGLNQIVGHTYDEIVRSMHTPLSKNICFDTGLNHYLIVENNKVTVKSI